MLGAATASSSSSTWQKLLPLPSVLSITVTVVPPGDVSLTSRSFANVWSIPTVGEPMVVLHAVPSIRKSTSVIELARPATVIVTLAGAPGLLPLRSRASGIGTAGPT